MLRLYPTHDLYKYQMKRTFTTSKAPAPPARARLRDLWRHHVHDPPLEIQPARTIHDLCLLLDLFERNARPSRSTSAGNFRPSLDPESSIHRSDRNKHSSGRKATRRSGHASRSEGTWWSHHHQLDLQESCGPCTERLHRLLHRLQRSLRPWRPESPNSGRDLHRNLYVLQSRSGYALARCLAAG